MKTIASRTALAAAILLTGLAPPALQGAAVIYESFTFPDADTSLTGNPGGTGLSGNWTAGGGWIESTPMTYGSLETSGDSSRVNGGWQSAQIGATSSAAYSALLANSAELWFSMIMEFNSDNNRSIFALTDIGLAAANGDLNTGGVGIGFGLAANETFYANVWSDDLNGNVGSNFNFAPDNNVTTTLNTGLSGSMSNTYFLVGRVQWGATSTDNDTVSLYMPGTDLVLGAPVSISSGVIADQSGLDLLGFINGANYVRYDEIRVGASYADVSPIPEPSAAFLGGLGTLLLLRRRR
ncbi:hypothetical protein HZ994_12150 [Akkermansiaceae bacterium]|nr:hypothetical protein HZ994_12150 [Akkermansiaceae bacterium]